MYSSVRSSTVVGVDGMPIYVEADIHDGLPAFSMVGYLSASVKEAGERVRTALKNSGVYLPAKRITINLYPADIRKDGSGYDLPIAIAVLLSLGIVPTLNMDETLVIGELGLDGRVKAVPGVLPMVHNGFKNGINRCIVPFENATEAALVEGMEVLGVSSLYETMSLLQGFSQARCAVFKQSKENKEYNVDFSDIKGQETMKRGMEIAAAGFHNVLMSGAAGSGKSMIAKRLPTILPPLSFEESIEVTKIYSIANMLDEKTLVKERPFRSPHHTVSGKALVGGGVIPKPGEVSLAHNGVLFLDELPEFSKNTLEVLRQPIEDRCVNISRLNACYCFPADFMLVAAMNPCPCGYFPDAKRCHCSPGQIHNYVGKISGPLMDRIDINMEVKPIQYEEMFSKSTGEKSKTIRDRVCKVREIQQYRYKDEKVSYNSQLEGDLISKYIKLNFESEVLLKDYFTKTSLSARGVTRILKLARTIADIEGCADIDIAHLMEAIHFRNGVRV